MPETTYDSKVQDFSPFIFLTLAEAAKVLGNGGRKPSIPTLWRWCRCGVRGVKLEYTKFGRQIRVTHAALAEFGRACAAADKPLDAPRVPVTVKHKTRSEAQRARDIKEAEDYLRKEGVMS